MANTPYFLQTANRKLNWGELPKISTELDSIRAYQWEIHFYGIPGVGKDQNLTLAAKQVSQTGFTVEDIEVHRLNDKVFYPGKTSPEELSVVFDNLYRSKMSEKLFSWIQTVYDPITGIIESGTNENGGNLKVHAKILQLGNSGQVLSVTELYGLYPKSWKQAEFNYATNEFHTIEVTFRYDFVVQKSANDSK